MAITANRVMVLVLGSQKGISAAQWAKSNLLGAATDNVILVRATKISGSILSAVPWISQPVPTTEVKDGAEDDVLVPLLDCFKVNVRALSIHCQHRRAAILQLIRDENITHLVLEVDDSNGFRLFEPSSQAFCQAMLQKAPCEVIMVGGKVEVVSRTVQEPTGYATKKGLASLLEGFDHDTQIGSGEDDDYCPDRFGAPGYDARVSRHGQVLFRRSHSYVARMDGDFSSAIRAPVGSIEDWGLPSPRTTTPIRIPARWDSAAGDSSSSASTPESPGLFAGWHAKDVFGAHAGPCKPLMQDAAKSLRRVGFSVFVDKESLNPADDAPAKISDAARGARIGLAFIDTNFLERTDPMQELQWIVDAGTLLPVIIDMSFEVFKRKLRDSIKARKLDSSYYRRVCKKSAILVDTSVMTRSEICQRIVFAVTRIYIEQVCGRLPDSRCSFRYLSTAHKAVEKLNKDIRKGHFIPLSAADFETATTTWPQLLDSYSSPPV